MTALAIIVAFSRPAMRESVLTNVARQKHADRVLVVIENGPGHGCAWPEGTVVLTGPEHPALARNVGLDWAAAHGLPWVTQDDDDWYGPGYLAEFAAAFADGVEFAGKGRAYMWLRDGIVYNRRATGFTGGALGSTGSTLRFPGICPNEDVALVEEARLRGLRVERLSDRNYVYRRNYGPGHRHAWIAEDEIALATVPGDWVRVGDDPWVSTLNEAPSLGVRPRPTRNEMLAAVSRMP